MGVVRFAGYGVGSTDVYVVVEQISTFFEVGYNGVCGTKIILTTGKEILVSTAPWVVADIVEKSFGNSRQ